jgi:hypothetical protein
MSVLFEDRVRFVHEIGIVPITGPGIENKVYIVSAAFMFSLVWGEGEREGPVLRLYKLLAFSVRRERQDENYRISRRCDLHMQCCSRDNYRYTYQKVGTLHQQV